MLSMTLVDSVLAGDRLALARVLTQVENDTPEGRAALSALFPSTGGAHLIGVTGPPGTGKSSLVNQLALHFRAGQKRVAIVADDPPRSINRGIMLDDNSLYQEYIRERLRIRSTHKRRRLPRSGEPHSTRTISDQGGA